MKNQLFKAMSLGALIAFQSAIAASCGKDDAQPGEIAPPVLKPNGAYILCEGNQGQNNAALDFVDMDNSLVPNIFASANGEALGDTGQDLAEYGGRLYVSVFGSRYIAKLDNSGKLLDKYQFSDSEGQPRFLACSGGNVYVSLYSGQVAKFDTASLAKPLGFAQTGSLPEQMAIAGGLLLVANSSNSYAGKANDMISVIDLKTFSSRQEIKVSDNLQSIIAVGDSVYATFYNPDFSISMVNVDVRGAKVSSTLPATKMACLGDCLYCANSATVYDENWNASTSTTFFKRYTKSGEVRNMISFDGCAELKSAVVYLLEVNPYSGDIFVGTSDYVTNGKIYRFDSSGNLIAKFQTSGLNPSQMAFLAE